MLDAKQAAAPPAAKKRPGVDIQEVSPSPLKEKGGKKGGGKGSGAGRTGRQGRQSAKGSSSGSLAQLSARLDEVEKTQALHGKAILQTSDDVRDLKGIHQFVWAYADQSHALIEAVKAEGVAYNTLQQEDKAMAVEAGEAHDPKKRGPASAHQFPVLIEKMVQEGLKAEEGAEGAKHFETVKALQSQLAVCQGPQEVGFLAGVFQIENAHATTKKLVLRANLTAEQDAAIQFVLAKQGSKVHTAGQPPRNGLQRAVQSNLDDQQL